MARVSARPSRDLDRSRISAPRTPVLAPVDDELSAEEAPSAENDHSFEEHDENEDKNDIEDHEQDPDDGGLIDDHPSDADNDDSNAALRILDAYRSSVSTMPSSSASTSDYDNESLPSQAHRTPRALRSPTRQRPLRQPMFTARTVSASSASSAGAENMPLVLLHVTILPLPEIWGAAGAQGVVSESTRRKVARLKARLAPETLARGLLMRHPRSDLGLLEERVLQGLELLPERIGSDGHFSSLDVGEDERVDSGTEVESDAKAKHTCETCLKRRTGLADGVGGRREWDVKVFAANGLMKTSTWALAWEDMERVDVLVTPWISEDEKAAIEAVGAAENVQPNDMSRRQQTTSSSAEKPFERNSAALEVIESLEVRLRELEAQQNRSAETALGQQSQPLPPAYSVEQLPLEVLLRNYLYVQAKDLRNLIILALLALSIMLSFQLSASKAVKSTPSTASCEVLGQSIAQSLLSLRPESERYTELASSKLGTPIDPSEGLSAVIVSNTSDFGSDNTQQTAQIEAAVRS